ncbi:unnamed protein product [Meganyctiphanes norvegica]|uniref:Uncharacterized protein n=1 Tax=Meganyctiphanes norvegica TaxID=48144 RepID=A0AAV2R9T3_MEGNR
MAVVLSFSSFRDAKRMVKKYEKIKRKTSPGEKIILSDTLEGKQKENFVNDNDGKKIANKKEERYVNEDEEDCGEKHKDDSYINDEIEENPNISNTAPKLPPRNKSDNNVTNNASRYRTVSKDSPPPIPTSHKPYQTDIAQLPHEPYQTIIEHFKHNSKKG